MPKESEYLKVTNKRRPIHNFWQGEAGRLYRVILNIGVIKWEHFDLSELFIYCK